MPVCFREGRWVYEALVFRPAFGTSGQIGPMLQVRQLNKMQLFASLFHCAKTKRMPLGVKQGG